jgi:hypothetical protein
MEKPLQYLVNPLAHLARQVDTQIPEGESGVDQEQPSDFGTRVETLQEGRCMAPQVAVRLDRDRFPGIRPKRPATGPKPRLVGRRAARVAAIHDVLAFLGLRVDVPAA